MSRTFLGGSGGRRGPNWVVWGWGITPATQLPGPLVCGRAAAGGFHFFEVHLVFGASAAASFSGGGVLADLAAANIFRGGWGDGSSAKTLIFAACPRGYRGSHFLYEATTSCALI